MYVEVRWKLPVSMLVSLAWLCRLWENHGVFLSRESNMLVSASTKVGQSWERVWPGLALVQF